jgi:glycosyltransferase involved in cell wall biosynthesis
VAFSNFGLHTMRNAKKTGGITILERGSSHMLYQMSILAEEYIRAGIKPRLAHPKIIEKELKEYEEADYISIPSKFVKRTFIEKMIPERKLIHVPYGVDLQEFRQVSKSDNVFRVVYAGAMTLQKGVHYLLQAFSELNLPRSELLLFGGLSDEIKYFFKKYEGSYKWVGHVPQRELYRYYSEGSVFAFMSIQDGFGMVMAQAMACGLPVICTTNTGGEDIVREGIDGFIIPIRDVKALKEKLVYLYENIEICKAMGLSAKERVSEGFTWDDYGEKMIKMYKEILNGKK